MSAKIENSSKAAKSDNAGTEYCCAHCATTYDGKRFHCYGFDCCSSKCLTEKIKPFREAEIIKELAARSGTRGEGRFECGGGDCR